MSMERRYVSSSMERRHSSHCRSRQQCGLHWHQNNTPDRLTPPCTCTGKLIKSIHDKLENTQKVQTYARLPSTILATSYISLPKFADVSPVSAGLPNLNHGQVITIGQLLAWRFSPWNLTLTSQMVIDAKHLSNLMNIGHVVFEKSHGMCT